MSLNIGQTTRTRSVGIFLSLIVVAIVGVYVLFDFYLSSVSREIAGSWLQTEAVNIQEGNLLSSITKSQRILLSSQFIKSVVLFDLSTERHQRLIEIGVSGKDYGALKHSEELAVGSAGFLHKHVLYGIPNRQDLVLVFDVESSFLDTIFFVSVGTLLLFVLSFVFSIRAIQNLEFKKREQYLKRTLEEFITAETASNFIETELPFLTKWWREKRSEAADAKKLAIGNQSKILLGELAGRVAHDIRSPLNTLETVVDASKGLSPEAVTLLKTAVVRIREITNGIADRNREILQTTPAGKLINVEQEAIHLYPVLESLVHEKQIQYRDQGDIEIVFQSDWSAQSAFAQINAIEFRRNLSNLIDNAVEALTSKGRVCVSMFKSEKNIKIEIADNGKGIPKTILDQIGQKGFTYGKAGGSGLGVFYARETVTAWSGSLEIDSKVGSGTTVSIKIPSEENGIYVNEIKIAKDSDLIIIDDDRLIHATWRLKLKNLALESNGVQVFYFFKPAEILAWFTRREIGRKFTVLSDYHLGEEEMSGVQVIETLKVADHSVLVTSAYDDPTVVLGCSELGLKILPKFRLNETSLIF